MATAGAMGLDGSKQLLARQGQEDTRREEGPGGGGSWRVWPAEMTDERADGDDRWRGPTAMTDGKDRRR